MEQEAGAKVKNRVAICVVILSFYGCRDGQEPLTALDKLKATIVFTVVVGQTNGVPSTEIFLASPDGRLAKVSQASPCFNRNPAVSPDGGKVVYVSCSSPYGEDLFRVTTDAMQTQNITRAPDFEDHPLWSPDGSRIAYESVSGGNRGIVVMDSGGRQFTRIAHPSENLTLGNWSPNGNALVYSAHGQDSTVGQIFTVQVGTLAIAQLTSGPGLKAHPAWSRGGTRIAYVRTGRIRIMNANGFGDTSLIFSPDSVTGHINWSSQDAWLIFEARSSGRTDVYRISGEGTTKANLTGNSHPGSSPALSSDDRNIAYVADLAGLTKIYLMAPDGSEMRPLTTFTVNEFQPAWKK